MWESSPFSARLILWSAFGDAALTRPGRTISLGEGIDKHADVHLVFVIPVYLVSFYLK